MDTIFLNKTQLPPGMKRLLASAIAMLLIIGWIQAQNITEVEYFFNNDPGFGSGTVVSVGTPASDLSIFNFDVGFGALQDGVHTLFVRVKDENGKWSATNYRLFFKDSFIPSSPPYITHMEYFFDTDPGFGMGTPDDFYEAGGIVSGNYAIDITALSNGLHTLFVRTKNSEGVWSQTLHRTFFKDSFVVQPLYDITHMEYFFDTDPGFGLGTHIPFSPSGSDVAASHAIDISHLNEGLHAFFVRVKNSNETWSITSHRTFFKSSFISPPASDITNLEYFIDNDPGFGQGTALAFSPAGTNVSKSFNIDITSVPSGFHTLYIRAMNEDGRWSITSMHHFMKQTLRDLPPDLVKVEYFVNNDPGFGLGTVVEIPAPADHIEDFSFLVDVSDLLVGNHTFFVRVLDQDGNWGHTNSFEYCKPPVPGFETNVVYAGEPTQFTNTSTSTDEFTQFNWDVNNDGIIDYTGGSNFQHIYPGAGVYQAKLIVISQEGCSDTLVHNVYVHDCLPPGGLVAINITTNSATLHWTPANIETAWNLEYGPGNFTPGTGTTISNVLMNSYLLTGLAPGVDYDFYVQSVCGVDYFSALAGPGTFQTMTQTLPGNPVAYYPFTGNANDHSGNNYHGIVSAATLTTDRFGNPNSAYYFNGSSAFVTIPFIAPFNSNSHTICAWIQTSASDGRIIAFPNGGLQHFSLNVGLPQATKASVYFDGNGVNQTSSTTNVIDGTWRFIAGVIDGTNMTVRIYVDGVLENSSSTNGHPYPGVEYLSIGRFNQSYGEYFTGKIDDVIIYNEALTSQQILSLYDPNAACQNPTDGGSIAASHTICSGSYPDPFTSVSPATGHIGDLQYQWQISDDNTTFFNIGGANSESYTHMSIITNTMWFKRLAKVSCEPNWNGAASSNVLQIDVEPSGQYRSKASGDWNNPATWEFYNGSQWVDAIDYPGENPGSCPNTLATILNAHTVTVTANITFGNIVVNGGGTLVVNNNVVLMLPAAANLTVYGTLMMYPTALINGAGNFTLAAGCTMHIGSAQGIHVSGLLGHIQVTGTISYASGVHYVFFGGQNQLTGDGISQNIPGSIIINNSGFVVTLSVSITISGDVNIIAGSFDANGFDISLGGNWFNTGTFIPGTGTVYFNCTIDVFVSASDFCNVVFGGTGTVTATGALTIYGTITINYIFNGGSYSHYVYGSWYNYGTYVYGTSTIYFACTIDVYVSGGSFYNVVFTGTGTVTATGSITFYGYVNVVNHFYAGTWYHVVYGSWTVGGSFVPGASTIEFQGTNDVDITDSYFNNVVFSGSGTNTATGPIVFYGNVTINSHFNAGSFTHMVYGNWTVTGTFVYGTSTIDFHGSGNALIGTSSFYNVIFCGTGTNTATGSLTFYGNVNITWHFDAGSFTHYVYGNWTLSGVFIHGTSTIDFHGSGNALIGSSNFYNVIFCGTGTNTANGPLTFYGYVNITWHFNAGSFTHYVYGNWTVTGAFVYGTSTIDFHGSGNALIGSSSFYHVIFCGTGTNTATGPLTFYGNVLITWHFNAGSFTHLIYGNWTVTGTFVHGTSTIDFHGSGNALIGSSNFYNVIFCGTGTNTATGSLTFYGNVLITWHFNAGSYVHYVYGNWVNNAVFAWGTSTINFMGTVVQIIGGSTQTEFHGFVVNCPGGITLERNITVHFSITLTIGIIHTGSYAVILVPVATLAGGSVDCYISGKLIRGFSTTGSKFFPVGKGGFYQPLTYNCLTLTGTSMVEVELILDIIPGTIPSNITTVNRHWAVSQTGGSGITFQLTCYDEDIIPCCYVRMLRSDGANVSAHNTSAPDYTNEVAFSAFGSFSLGVEPCIEPDIPPLSADVSICPEGNVNLEVLSGNLNDAEEWVWYADACGQNQVGTGLKINVSPEITTTYYVRGESSCIVTGDCASVTVTVDPLPEVQCPYGFCVPADEEDFELPAANPSGGIYAGTGVTQNQQGIYIFSPDGAGEGSHVITYTYTDPVTGCVNECMFVITAGHIPYNLDVENHTIPAMTDTCFNACNTIMVENVVAEPAGIARFFAGQRVILKPGVHFMAGSDVNVFISTNGIFCEDVPLVAAQEESKVAESTLAPEGSEYPESETGLFKVYPNPTPGRFTIELTGLKEHTDVVIEIYSIFGERIQSYEYAALKQYHFDLSDHQPGIYLIRLIRDDEAGVGKIILR